MEKLNEQDALFSLRNYFEGLSPLELRAHRIKMLSDISDREQAINIINDVLDGYGENNDEHNE